MDQPPAGGDDVAHRFEELTGITVEEAAAFVYTEAKRQTRGDRTSASDLAQTTWVRIIDRITSGELGEPVDSPKAWLGTLVRRIAIDQHRERTAEKRSPGERVRSLSELTEATEPAAPGRRPDDVAVASDLGRRLVAAITALPPGQQAVVELVRRGYSHPEIAELLDIPVGTSKTRFRSAAKHLRAIPGLARD